MDISFGADYDLCVAGWEAKQNDLGVIYYASQSLGMTSWNHPYLNKVFEEIGECNEIKYAAYRTAFKLRSIQCKLGLHWINLQSIKNVFSHFHQRRQESRDFVSCTEATSLIYQVLDSSDHRNQHREHLEKAADTILSLILCLYDMNRRGKLTERSLGIALVTLCKARLSEKYRFFFSEISDEHGKISREKFLYFIDDMMQISDVIKESAAFGTNVTSAVNSCFALHPSSSTDGVDEDTFYTWLLKEPQTLVWLPTLHRIIATESVQHDTKCAYCGSTPITGFRYRCLQCLNYDLCQHCFLRGLTSASHKLKHPVQEYCLPASKKDNTKALLKIMRNKLSRRHRNRSKVKYLPVDHDGDSGAVFEWQPRNVQGNPQLCGPSLSMDSGLAGSSEPDEGATGIQLSTSEDDTFTKRRNRPEEVLGVPCVASSPFVGGVEDCGRLSKQDMELQQQIMASKIERLQQENRLLYRKLRVLQKHCGGETFNLSNLDDAEDEEDDDHQSVAAAAAAFLADPLTDITADQPISPINVSERENSIIQVRDSVNETSEPSDVKNYIEPTEGDFYSTLDIVGPQTPIAPSIWEGQVPGENNEDICRNKEKEEVQDGMTAATKVLSQPESRVEIYIETPETSVEDQGLAYRSSDMTLRSNLVLGTRIEDPGENNDEMSIKTESTQSNEIEYTLSDMSLSILTDASKPPSVAGESVKSQSQAKIYGQGNDVPNMLEDCLNMVNKGPSLSAASSLKSAGCGDKVRPRESLWKTGSQLDSPSGTTSVESSKHKPRLILSSDSLRSSKSTKHRLPRSSDHLLPTKTQPGNSVRSGSQKNSLSPLNSSPAGNISGDTCLELSEILPTDTTALQFHSCSVLSKDRISPLEVDANPRRKTLEPVHMSTPVYQKKLAGIKPKSTYIRRPRSMGSVELACPAFNKENVEKILVSGHRKGGGTRVEGSTPVSAIPPWQKKKILQSHNTSINRSLSCNDVTQGSNSTEGLSVMFQRAERMGKSQNKGNSQSLGTQDREEMELLLMKIGADDSLGDTKQGANPADSSMLKAVLNIGDAMADWVQATADHPKEK